MRFLPVLPLTIVLGVGTFNSLAEDESLTSAPVIPGLHRLPPLSEALAGAALINELRCASCHDGITTTPPASAPDLTQVGSRLNPDFLRKFIEAPSRHDPGTTMPTLLAHRPAAERAELADSLTAYLLSLSDEPPRSPAPLEGNASAGKQLFHEAGCIACHAPRDEHGKELSRPGDVGLAHVPAKYRPDGLVAFLHNPLQARPSGRMPDMGLNFQEAEALAVYLLGKEETKTKQLPLKESIAQISAGQRAFTELRCTNCHQIDEAPAGIPPHHSMGPPRSELDLNRGCLSDSTGNAPNYHLSDDQRSAIRSALTVQPITAEPTDAIRLRLTQLNCISCHQRDQYGGVPQDRDAYFHSTEEALGDEARLPPPLTLAGAKLRPEWMNKVLYEGERVRPYMTTRMPQYGVEALDGLTELFGQADHLEPHEFAPPDRESKPMMNNGGHLLLGNKGLNCIACHNFNGKESPGMKGLDLMTSYQRLQPAWFNQFMKNPASLRPGIVMPNFWPDGKAVQTEILNGDTEEQLRALWHYFSLGRSARDPSGLKVENDRLVVTDHTRTYRGRSNEAGYRGIAVGYPGGLNYAFNAQNGALSAIWKGDYVTVGWRGQGSGNFKPAGPTIRLPGDVAFLPRAEKPWPLQPQRTKEHPVNPDPTYPRQYGYAFQGYSIDDTGVPTFRYRCGEVSIEDSSIALTEASPPVLRRTLTFRSPAAAELHLRALTGEIEKVSTTSFSNADLKLTLGSESIASSVRDADGKDSAELLLRFALPAGTSTHTIDYALRR